MARCQLIRPRHPAASLTGIGASSIQPFYGRVLYQYNKLNPGVTVNFTGSGSGPGVTAIEQNTASFGQSEVPMTAAQLAASKGPVLQVPVDLGGVAISYHVNGVSGGLKLDGPTLGKIYLRQITNWNDPAIAALNPSVTLPNENIVPVFRSDTSGPGYDLDQYLIDTSTAWTGAIATTSPSTTWPTAGRATGDFGQDLNAGVAGYIQETEGAIGYVEYSYALEANFYERSAPHQEQHLRDPFGQHHCRRRCHCDFARAPPTSTSSGAPEARRTRWPTSAGPCSTRSRRPPTPASSSASSSNG